MKNKDIIETDFLGGKSDCPLTYFKIGILSNIDAFKKILPKNREQNRSIVVAITLEMGGKRYRISDCHLFTIKIDSAYGHASRIIFFLLAVPSVHDEVFREDKIVKLERLTMTTKNPRITKIIDIDR